MTAEGIESQADLAVTLNRGMTSLSDEGVEMMTSEGDKTESENNPLVSGRAVSTTSRAGSSVHSGVYFD